MSERKVAIVTGASRGIGQAIAETLARQGLLVVGTATTESGAEAISERLKELGDGHLGLALDVTSDASIAALFDGLSSRGLTPLVLVNNAGITRDNLLMRMKDEEWSAVLEANLSAVFKLCRSAIRAMLKARYGRIINITSVVGASGNAGQANYAAAKAGVVGMTRSLARELGSRGITVNCVSPGFIATDMTAVLTEAQKEAMLGQIPLGSLGQPQDVAQAVAYLAQAAYVTGQELHVNGGMWMG